MSLRDFFKKFTQNLSFTSVVLACGMGSELLHMDLTDLLQHPFAYICFLEVLLPLL